MRTVQPEPTSNLGVSSNTIVFAILLACIAISVVSVRLIVGSVGYVVTHFPELITPAFVVGCLAACAFAWVRYPSEAPYLRITLAGSSVLLGLNSLWLGYDFPIVYQEIYNGVAPVAAVSAFVVAIATALSIFRPSFALVPAAVLLIQKRLVTAMSGGMPGTNHYIVLNDTIVLIVVALIAFAIARLAVRRFADGPLADSLSNEQNLALYYLTVMCIALGMHFGNYFLSGYGKIVLDGGAVSWLLENKTQYLMLGGYNLGAAPLSFSNPLFGTLYTLMDNGYVLSNTVVLFAQFFCFLAFLRKQLMMAWIVFFDIMHVSIFLLTGALFFHWIVLNALLLWSISKMPKDLAPRPALIAGIVATIIGHVIFHTVMLAWYDNRQVRDTQVIAMFDDGSEARVPPTYFRESSYLFYNRWFRDQPTAAPFDAHKPPPKLIELSQQADTYAWGQVGRVELMRLGEDCAIPVEREDAKVDFDVRAVRSFVTARHNWAMDRLDKGEALHYTLFPHDHFSMPWFFKKFQSADLKQIAGYYYQVETVCLDWKEGAFERRVVARTVTEPFWVKGDGDGAAGTR